MTLDQVTKGQCVKISEIADATVRNQIIRFGLSVGELAICQEKLPKGPIVLRKNRQEIAIGRKLATTIQVEVIPT